MEFNKKLTKEQENNYVTICELAWGCSPIDVDWAQETTLYKEIEIKLLGKKEADECGCGMQTTINK